MSNNANKKLKMKKNIETLIKCLNKIGISPYNIICILQEGSSLYVKHPNDIDYKVIVKKLNPVADIEQDFIIGGKKVECVYYTLKEWENVMLEHNAYFITECKDMKCVYGDDSKFKRYDVVNDINVQKYVLGIYDKYFFKDSDMYLGDKRLWNFLVFAYKVLNKTDKLTEEQLNLVNKAHDLKLNKDDFRPLFEKLKEEIL